MFIDHAYVFFCEMPIQTIFLMGVFFKPIREIVYIFQVVIFCLLHVYKYLLPICRLYFHILMVSFDEQKLKILVCQIY